jgi:glucose-6-phosphate 1-epimerase
VLQELASRFAIPSVIDFATGKGGLIKAVITTPHASGEVYLNGAHVTAYQPNGQPPVLFVSQKSHWEAGKPIRGGVPICFPWFGPLEGRDTAPAHGFARTSQWDVLETKLNPDGSAMIALGLTQPLNPVAFWPHAFRARYEVTIGPTLLLELTISHIGGEPFLFEEALHSYFSVGDVRQATVTGLAGTHYLDKLQGNRELMEHMAPIRIVGETDRIYLNTLGDCVIDDPVLNRRIINTKYNSDTTVLWNPWINKARAMSDFGDDEWPRMLCIETCNVGPFAVTLKPGESHTMTAEIKGVPRS